MLTQTPCYHALKCFFAHEIGVLDLHGAIAVLSHGLTGAWEWQQAEHLHRQGLQVTGDISFGSKPDLIFSAQPIAEPKGALWVQVPCNIAETKQPILSLVDSMRWLCERFRIKHNLDRVQVCPECGNLSFIRDLGLRACFVCRPFLERPTTFAKETEGYVYVASDGNMVKIGRSKAFPNSRIRTLYRGYYSPFKLLAYAHVDAHESWELHLHGVFEKKRVKHEWFNVEPVEIYDTMRTLLGDRFVVVAESVTETDLQPR